jgi:hypothetical protein
MRLRGKGSDIAGQEPQDPAPGDHQPQAVPKGRDPIDRHLPLAILALLWPEMTAQS